MSTTSVGAASPLLLALGCTPAVSLNEVPTDTESGPGGATTTATRPIDDAEPSLGVDESGEGGLKLDIGGGGPRLDLPPGPLPPGVCPPDCQFELSRVWAYDGGLPGPVSPEDRVLVAVDDDQTIVAEQRQGAITLAHVEPNGQESWTLPLLLPCDPCRLVSMGLHPSGDVILAAEGVDPDANFAAFVARIERAEPRLLWAESTPLRFAPDVVPRAGSAAVLDPSYLVQPAVEGTVDDRERLVLLVYDAEDGQRVLTHELVAGAATAGAERPLVATESEGVVAVSRPLGEGAGSTVDWVTALDGEPLAGGNRPAAIIGLARAADPRIISLGLTPSPGSATLLLHSGDELAPVQWDTEHEQPTDSAPLPALAIDPLGHAHVAMRIATGAPGLEAETSVQLLRWSEGGGLLWQVTLPLRTDYTFAPISLALTGEDLVLGGFVDQGRHAERRSPRCVCG